MSLRKRAAQFIAALAIAVTALTSVGLTASLDSPFSLRIRPVLLRVDRTAMVESRAGALGLDIDIRIGSFHLHYAWSAFPLFPVSTKGDSSTL